MKTIAFDVMGNDKGVQAGVEAAITFTQKYIEYKIILVGDRDKISKYTKETEKIEIVDVKEEVDPNQGALAARRANTSMSVAMDLVKEGRAQAVLSSGSSASLISLSILKVGRLPSIKRPAFMPIFPTIIKDKKFIMMDVGANLETKSENLVQWAKLGAIFSEEVLEIKKPSVGLINIGTEQNKGFDFHQEANAELLNSHSFNYVGFIEPRGLLHGNVDVAIADGYGGNLILKSMEGSTLALMKMLKEKLTKNLWRKIGALISKKAFVDVKETLDYRNVGAAWVLGVKGIVIKAHGSSDKKAYIGALNQVRLGIQRDVIAKFERVI